MIIFLVCKQISSTGFCYGLCSDVGIPLFMRSGDENESDKAVFGQILSNVKKQIKLDSIMVYDSDLLSLKTSN